MLSKREIGEDKLNRKHVFCTELAQHKKVLTITQNFEDATAHYHEATEQIMSH